MPIATVYLYEGASGCNYYVPPMPQTWNVLMGRELDFAFMEPGLNSEFGFCVFRRQHLSGTRHTYLVSVFWCEVLSKVRLA